MTRKNEGRWEKRKERRRAVRGREYERVNMSDLNASHYV